MESAVPHEGEVAATGNPAMTATVLLLTKRRASKMKC